LVRHNSAAARPDLNPEAGQPDRAHRYTAHSGQGKPDLATDLGNSDRLVLDNSDPRPKAAEALAAPIQLPQELWITRPNSLREKDG
jgi:hypothetical protein